MNRKQRFVENLKLLVITPFLMVLAFLVLVISIPLYVIVNLGDTRKSNGSNGGPSG